MLFCSMVKQPEKPCCDERHGVELRLDLLPRIDFDFIKNIIQQSSAPVVLTLRKVSQGGQFQGTEEERESLIEKLLALEPPYFDLEIEMRPAFLTRALSQYPKTTFILSSHHFEGCPKEYPKMVEHKRLTYKIAAMVQSSNEALRMLLWSKEHPQASAVCMGERGEFARVLGAVVGNRVNYGCLNVEEKAAPGQLTLSDLFEIYNWGSLNQQTAIYGLIGDPVENSPGHRHHNAVFRKRGINAVYVKMVVKPEELEEFVPLAKAIGIRGLSVTIPLKEKILPFIDEIDPDSQKIGAINTLRFDKERILGTNTDGHGALDAIEKVSAVKGKTVVLLGAGGSARAIAYEALRRGASVVVLNRTVERAQELAKEFGCEAGSLDQVPDCYDVLINCCPPGEVPIAPENILPETVAMDVIYTPKETPFLQEAAKKNCQLVYGEEMFLNQAARQTTFWLD